MKGLIEWFGERENQYLFGHVAGVFALALIAQLVEKDFTQWAFPAIVLLAASSFTYFYPVESIKKQGLFAEYMIELRLLWLVVFSVLAEYAAYMFTELGYDPLEHLLALAAIAVGLLVAFYCRAKLKKKIVANRGWN
ncbi:hypothetical protein COX86_01625 [Candidatus Micrarchaeota archaeon CG_4_10_14_0_2_um_filter_60_11]|nr:MAG: hypothetical protein AUJ16_03830 [Candidatus Micrarchaeota archaeon CG1_02_60_51]PIY91764.1 MAG: hypothetical protein COY71_01360 [Candidatus Micrarchaeota archaeon CG_4_10_14_0_8_um_filter_60_7]PIZ91066.1 MAG: hypothetical protein COX86_01625 [Candidatus Micrarchaeota archaeon CG_4_10_14_0_2_um_filter_60_11]